MELAESFPFNPASDLGPVLEGIPSAPAVFAIFPVDAKTREGPANGAPTPPAVVDAPPYLGRTRNLRSRLARLLGPPAQGTKRLNLRQLARRVAYQLVGSNFEAQWWLYRLHKFYFPRQYRQRLRLRPPAMLRVNLSNRFPRCYPTRRLVRDGSIYYGPFPSRLAAERFASEFLDLFKIRRCVEDLHPDPTHPGCIYSQMQMCLAPCFQGCSDAEYHDELGRVVAFLDSEGASLVGEMESERAQASERTEYEHASKIHRKLEKVHEILRLRPGLVRRLEDLHAVVLQRAATPHSIAFFRVRSGEIYGPSVLSLDERVASPVPLDQQIHAVLDTLEQGEATDHGTASWEPLCLLARWYYSSFREGELVMLTRSQEIPHARLVRLCRKMLAGAATPNAAGPAKPRPDAKGQGSPPVSSEAAAVQQSANKRPGPALTEREPA